jgi:hypothetical protein
MRLCHGCGTACGADSAQVTAEAGIGIRFGSRKAVISFGSTAQDVLSLLGTIRTCLALCEHH